MALDHLNFGQGRGSPPANAAYVVARKYVPGIGDRLRWAMARHLVGEIGMSHRALHEASLFSAHAVDRCEGLSRAARNVRLAPSMAMGASCNVKLQPA